MSGKHDRFKVLRWPLSDETAIEPKRAECSKGRICVAMDLERRGWAYPPCVYTDNPEYSAFGNFNGDDRREDCLYFGTCAYAFVSAIEGFADQAVIR